MKLNYKKTVQSNRVLQEKKRIYDTERRLRLASSYEQKELEALLSMHIHGLRKEEVIASREKYGSNKIYHTQKISFMKQIANAFINPFTIVLLLLMVVSIFTDIILSDRNDRNYTTVIIISVMVMVSGFLRFIQESKSNRAADKLKQMIVTTACVERQEEGKKEILFDEIVVGDIIHLSAGDMIPADIRILEAKDLFVAQASLTGESEPQEKTSIALRADSSILELENLAFMGCSIVSGSACAVVVATGNDTFLGSISKGLQQKPEKTSFEKGVNSVSWVFIRFMLCMVPIVFFINGFTKGDWMDAALFAISIAVGLTPEMLPMIVTTCLAKGAVRMSNKKVIVKNLNSIQNLGSIDVLCTDKTGTLTQDEIIIEYHLDVNGNEDNRVLRHAFLNSYYQTGLKNLIDVAVINKVHEYAQYDTMFEDLENRYHKVDEIPFDFDRRRMSVVVEDATGKTQLITKGAIEEMLIACSFVEYDGHVSVLDDTMRNIILDKANELNEQGMRVIAVAHKTNPSAIHEFSIKDETDMVLIGYLALLDPPKETSATAIKALLEYGVNVKVLTGDNEKVATCICKQVGIDTQHILLGSDIENMSTQQLKEEIEKTCIFAKLSPSQKAEIIHLLKENGHCVGYMGDGINDALAMKAADVGISVDTAVDIAKESAGVILLEKDLMVLEDGIIEGRKTYANMIKYIKMTASSNFGNMFSVLVASAFLPFLPMTSLQLILLNLIYDISCIAIPWDHVDEEYLKKPRNWDASSVSSFMIWIGPISSIFDITTYLLMFFILCPMVCGSSYSSISSAQTNALFIAIFQTGWFIESMWSQTLVIHMIRTPKIPFIQSHASAPVILLTFTGIFVLTIIPFTPFAAMIGLHALPLIYFVYLAVTIVTYMIFATIIKKLYVKIYKELL